MSSVSEKLASLIEDFSELSITDRLNLLLEFSDGLPDLPPHLADHPDLLERVEECQSPVYLFVEIDERNLGRLYFSAPREAPTTRGFASILHELLDSQPVAEILSIDEDFINRLGLAEAISPLRLRGMRAMLHRTKRQLQEKSLDLPS
jgi:cysteine desulfuration protein SufE